MNKTGILSIIAICCIVLVFTSCKREHLPAAYSTPPILDSFVKTFINQGNEEIFSIINSPDGNYIFTGTTTSFSNGGKDVFIGETDPNGNIIWSKAIGGAAEDGGRDIIITADNNLLIAGYSRSFNINSNYEAYLIKTTFTGTVLWQKTYDIASSFTKVEISNNSSGYIAVGGAYGFTNNLGRTFFISNINDTGTIVWSKNYFGLNQNEMANNFCYDNSGNLMVIGSAQDIYPNNDLYVLKLNANGDTLWGKSVAGNGYETCSNIVNMGNGNFTICSSSGTVTDPLGITTITQSDANGNMNFLKNFQSQNAYSGDWIIKTSDNHLLLTGSQTDSAGNNPCYLTKMDYSGNLTWSRTYGNTLNYTVHHVLETSDSYLIAGAQNVSADTTRALMIKVKK